jgi:hypothetical protein
MYIQIDSKNGIIFLKMSDLEGMINSAFGNQEAGFLLGPAIIIGMMIIQGFCILGTAFWFEKGKNIKTAGIFLLMILEFCLLSVFSDNPLIALAGFLSSFTIQAFLLQIYGFSVSKQIYNGMQRNGLLSSSHDKLYWISVGLMSLGFLLQLIMVSNPTFESLNYLSWISQLFVAIGWILWMHFLNKMRRNSVSPRVIRRMFWASLMILMNGVIIILVTVIYFTRIQIGEISDDALESHIKDLCWIAAIFINFEHTALLSLTGYTIWDLFKLKKDQFDQEQKKIFGITREMNIEVLT